MHPLLLLHGALGAANQFDILKSKLIGYFDIHAFDFRGHGADPYEGIQTMELLSSDIMTFMDALGLEQVNIFGYSMGGYAAVLAAMEHPERIRRIMTLGTKWQWDAEAVAMELKMLDAKTIAEKVPAYAEMLRVRHTGQGWQALVRRTAELIGHLGFTGGPTESDFGRVHIPACVCRGSEDRMVTKEESEYASGCMPKGVYRQLEGLPHPLEKVDMNILAEEIFCFFLHHDLKKKKTDLG